MNEAQSRSPDEVERDIERTRADIDRTLTILQDKISPAAVMDRALRSTRESGGEFAASVGRTARDNPVPLALLGISLAWLMLSNRDRGYQRETVGTMEMDRSDPSRPSAAYTETVETTGVASTEYQTADSSSAGSKVGAAGSAVRDKAAGAAASAAEMRDKAQAAASDAYRKAGGKIDEVKQRAGETYEQAAARAAQQTDEVHRRATDAKGRVAVRTGDALDDVQGFVREHPILVGAMAVAIGAGLAALLPRTRRENELMGDRSDALKDTARDTATVQVDRAKRTGEAAAAEAKAEAGRQGLTAQELRGELEAKASAAKKVASAAGKAAGDEAKREAPAKTDTPANTDTPAAKPASASGSGSSPLPTPPTAASKTAATTGAGSSGSNSPSTTSAKPAGPRPSKT